MTQPAIKQDDETLFEQRLAEFYKALENLNKTTKISESEKPENVRRTVKNHIRAS